MTLLPLQAILLCEQVYENTSDRVQTYPYTLSRVRKANNDCDDELDIFAFFEI